MAHYIWNDCVNTYVITGRLGARVLIVRRNYKFGDEKRIISIDDDTKPADVIFIGDIHGSGFRSLSGFRVFICGKPYDIITRATNDIHFAENPYVDPANMLSRLGKMIGLESVSDTTIEQELSTRLEYLKILEDNNLMDLVRLCYEQKQTIDKLRLNSKKAIE